MDFFEDDEPVEKVVEAFKRGEKKRTRPSWRFRLVRALDTALHAVHMPSRWICDRYDLALGVTPEELRRGDISAQPETVMREYFDHHRDDIDAETARAIEPKWFGPPDDETAYLLGNPLNARRLKMSVADLDAPRPSGYACPHGSVGSSSNVVLSDWTCGHGCTMQAVYA